MRIYLDSSALIKRVIAEDESDALVDAIDEYYREGHLLISSALAWVEISRALRNHDDANFVAVAGTVDDAMSGVAEQPMVVEALGLARRVGPNRLRSLDAIHLACARFVNADLVVTYDQRLAEACIINGVPTVSPGR